MRSFLALTFVIIFVIVFLATGTMAYDNDKPIIYYYYSEDCEHCINIKKEFFPDLLEKYGEYFIFRELEVSKSGVIDSLFAMEDRVGIPENEKDYPAVYLLGTMVEGEIPVRMCLEHVMEAYLANPDSMRKLDSIIRARIPDIVKSEISEADALVHLAYFYKHGCKEYRRTEESINWLKKTYSFVSVDIFDINGKREKLTATVLGIRTSVPEKRLMSTPVIFIGEDYLISGDISRQQLEILIKKYAKTGTKPYWRSFDDKDLEQTERQIAGMIQNFSVIAVVISGLADGINPCAFATIIFFVSYLGMVGRKGKEMVFVGLGFAFAVFMTYFIVGFGLFNIIKHVAHIKIAEKIIFGSTGITCIVFGFFSIGDYFKVRAGKTSDMSLRLPGFLKRHIHATIRKKIRMENFVFGVLVAGFMVSLLEFACTGQVYLPTITLVVQQEGINSIAVLYLLLYNFCFIVPLLVIFGIVCFGISLQGIAKIMETRVGSVKLILATVFFMVGGLLIWTVL